jgi:hypothetical protein
VGGAVGDVIGGAQARERQHARSRALLGNPNAIPRAKVEVDATQASDLVTLPDGVFRLSWQATKVGKRTADIVYWILQGMFGALLIFMLVMLVNLSSTFSSFSLPPMDVPRWTWVFLRSSHRS